MKINLKLPRIGMRNLKTAITASLIAFIYFFFDRSPAFACIGAVFGMGSSLKDSIQNGGNRFWGTIFGGFLGIALFRFYLIFFPDGRRTLFLPILIFIGIIILIRVCQYFWPGGVQPGSVVLCLLLYNISPATYISYSLNRMFDTGVGVLMALLINGVVPGGYVLDFLRKQKD